MMPATPDRLDVRVDPIGDRKNNKSCDITCADLCLQQEASLASVRSPHTKLPHAISFSGPGFYHLHGGRRKPLLTAHHGWYDNQDLILPGSHDTRSKRRLCVRTSALPGQDISSNTRPDTAIPKLMVSGDSLLDLHCVFDTGRSCFERWRCRIFSGGTFQEPRG
jgi:hypothetical protein